MTAEHDGKYEKFAQRLSYILIRLMAGERLTIKQLAIDYNVSERTIYRDMQRLEYVSDILPINKQENCYFIENQQRGQFNLQSLKTFAQLTGVDEIYPQTWNVQFINQLLNDGQQSIYQIKADTVEQHKSMLDIQFLKESITQKQTICFDYKAKNRIVEPYHLVYQQGFWYLAGVENERLKTYRISLMQHIQKTGKSFKMNSDIQQQIQQEQNIWFAPDDEKVNVLLHIGLEIASYFVQRAVVPEQKIVQHYADGALQIQSCVSHKLQIFPLVRVWLPHIRIVEPALWQHELEQSLRDYLGVC